MIIQVGFTSPVFKHPLPPGGTTPTGFPTGLEIVDEVVKSIKPEPAGDTEKELFVHTLTAAVQSLAVTCEYIVFTKQHVAVINSKIFFMITILSGY
jgi:hypothetical protein